MEYYCPSCCVASCVCWRCRASCVVCVFFIMPWIPDSSRWWWDGWLSWVTFHHQTKDPIISRDPSPSPTIRPKIIKSSCCHICSPFSVPWLCLLLLIDPVPFTYSFNSVAADCLTICLLGSFLRSKRKLVVTTVSRCCCWVFRSGQNSVVTAAPCWLYMYARACYFLNPDPFFPFYIHTYILKSFRFFHTYYIHSDFLVHYSIIRAYIVALYIQVKKISGLTLTCMH